MMVFPNYHVSGDTCHHKVSLAIGHARKSTGQAIVKWYIKYQFKGGVGLNISRGEY